MGEIAKKLAERYPYGLVGTLARSKGVGDFFSNLWNTPDLGFQPGGMVLSARNIPKLTNTVRELYDLNKDPVVQANAKLADSFIRAKYPKLYKLAESVGFPLDLGPNLGEYIPLLNRAYVGQATQGRFNSVEGLVNTITHELTHALQNARGKLPAKLTSAGESGYGLQSHEVLARRAGKTAQRAYNDFLKLTR